MPITRAVLVVLLLTLAISTIFTSTIASLLSLLMFIACSSPSSVSDLRANLRRGHSSSVAVLVRLQHRTMFSEGPTKFGDARRVGKERRTKDYRPTALDLQRWDEAFFIRGYSIMFHCTCFILLCLALSHSAERWQEMHGLTNSRSKDLIWLSKCTSFCSLPGDLEGRVAGGLWQPSTPFSEVQSSVPGYWLRLV